MAYSIVLIVAAFLFASSSFAQTVYPNETEDGTKHLYFGLVALLSIGSAIVPSVQVALDQINADPAMLPGYTLHYTLGDSQVSHTYIYVCKSLSPRQKGLSLEYNNSSAQQTYYITLLHLPTPMPINRHSYL